MCKRVGYTMFLKYAKLKQLPAVKLCSLNVWKRLHHAVPKTPTWIEPDKEALPQRTKIDVKQIEKLERLALVDFPSHVAVQRLEEVLQRVELLQLVDTTGVEPMDSVMEDTALWLREDVVTEEVAHEDIMQNASKTFEGYFVAPPGNIPLKKSYEHLERDRKTDIAEPVSDMPLKEPSDDEPLPKEPASETT